MAGLQAQVSSRQARSLRHGKLQDDLRGAPKERHPLEPLQGPRLQDFVSAPTTHHGHCATKRGFLGKSNELVVRLRDGIAPTSDSVAPFTCTLLRTQ